LSFQHHYIDATGLMSIHRGFHIVLQIIFSCTQSGKNRRGRQCICGIGRSWFDARNCCPRHAELLPGRTAGCVQLEGSGRNPQFLRTWGSKIDWL